MKIPEAIWRALLGHRLAMPHDYAVLRSRYSKHIGAYGWTRKWRVLSFVVVAEKNLNLWRGVRARLRRVNHFDYGWR